MNSPIGYGYQFDNVDKESLIQRLQVTIEASKQDKDNAIRLFFEPSFLENLVRLKEVSYPDYVVIKKQAENLVPVSEFRKALAKESRAIVRETQVNAEKDIPTLGETLGVHCPEQLSGLQIPYGWWVSMDGGVFKRHTDRFSNSEWINICKWPLVVSGVFKDYRTGDMKLELMFLRRGEWYTIIINRTDALNHQALQGKAAAKGAPVDSSNSKEVTRYLAAYEAINDHKFPEKYTVDKIGWLLDHKLLVTTEGIYSVNGKLTDSEFVFQPVQQPIEFRIQQNDVLSAAKEVIPKLLYLNQIEVSLPVIGWIFTSTISPFIRKMNDNQYPVLNIFGKPGSGKSTLAEIMLRVTGNKSELQRISTPYATMRQLSETNTLAAAYDEYKPTEMNERVVNQFTEKIKLSYRQDSDSRGKPGSVEYYPLIRPLLFIGEDYPRENQAVIERSCIVQLSRNWLENNKEEADSVCKSVLSHDLAAVSGTFWAFVFNYISNDKHLNEDLVEAQQIAKSFEDIHFRSRWNTTIIIVGMFMYKRLLEWLDCEVTFDQDDIKQAAAYTLTAVTEDQESILDRILVTFNYDHRNFMDTDIFLDPERHLLYVTASKFKAYVSMSNQLKCSAAQLKYELEYNFQSGGYVGNGKQEFYVQKKIRGRNGWRYVFHALKLEEATGIAEESWLPNELESPEEVSPTVKRRVLPERSGRLQPSNRKSPS